MDAELREAFAGAQSLAAGLEVVSGQTRRDPHGGSTPHSDHSIPDTCEYDTYRLFVDEGLRIGTYGTGGPLFSAAA